jgi:hypothetical protein
MIEKIVGASNRFERGYQDDPDWRNKFAHKMHKVAELVTQNAIMNNKEFCPMCIFVNTGSYMVVPVGEFLKTPEGKDQLAQELHDAARLKQDIIGIILITDVWMRTNENDNNPEDAIFTNAQWRDGSDLSIITKYVKKSDIEFEFKSPEVPVYDMQCGRLSNFFRKQQ